MMISQYSSRMGRCPFAGSHNVDSFMFVYIGFLGSEIFYKVKSTNASYFEA
jgi:hypothetical protein